MDFAAAPSKPESILFLDSRHGRACRIWACPSFEDTPRIWLREAWLFDSPRGILLRQRWEFLKMVYDLLYVKGHQKKAYLLV